MTKKNIYDETAVTELELFTENDGEIYKSRLTPIYKNLAKKQDKGVYDKEKAQKLYMYAVNDGAKKYQKEFSDSETKIFSSADKKEVAKRFEENNQDELKNYL